jgi:hypothetical protein
MSPEPSPSNLSPRDAQILIEKIARGHGWLSEDEREKVPEDLLRSLAVIQQQAGAVREL